MWNKRKAVLNGPVDFLKVGHHGSVNATPWNMGGSGGAAEPAAILDAILPVARKARAKAVVSTQRSTYETIPRSDLLSRNSAGGFRMRAAMPRSSSMPGSSPPTCRSSPNSGGQFCVPAAAAHRSRAHVARRRLYRRFD